MTAPTLDFDGNTFRYDHHSDSGQIARAAGFHWDAINANWYTRSPAVAVKLREYATETAQKKLNQVLIQVSPWLSPLPQPPKGLVLKDHQMTAAKFSLSRNRSYLGLDPRLGKTPIAATITRASKAVTVYVSPPFLLRNVEAEFKRWAPELETVIYGLQIYLGNENVLIVPDTALDDCMTKTDIKRFISPELKNPTLLIVDEAHRFKNPKAKRTQALFGSQTKAALVDYFDQQVYLSGSPMPNRPMELYPVLSKAAPETIDFMSVFDFGRRFCGGEKTSFYKGGKIQSRWDFSGDSNMKELASRVIAPSGPFMLRLRREELGLPPKIEEAFVVSASMNPRLAQLERGVGEDYRDIEDALKAAFTTDTSLHLATYRKLLGMEKVGPASDFILNLLDETDENILVFAFHKDVIAALEVKLAGYLPYVITGDTPVENRLNAVRAYQSTDSRRLMIGNYVALGIGFDISKADRVIFVEYDWVPGVNAQASDRAISMNKKDSILVQYVCYKDSLDKRVIEEFLRKREVLNHI